MGFPAGDIFYSSKTNIEVSVWLAKNDLYQSFAFAQWKTEEQFWSELKRDY